MHARVLTWLHAQPGSMDVVIGVDIVYTNFIPWLVSCTKYYLSDRGIALLACTKRVPPRWLLEQRAGTVPLSSSSSAAAESTTFCGNCGHQLKEGWRSSQKFCCDCGSSLLQPGGAVESMPDQRTTMVHARVECARLGPCVPIQPRPRTRRTSPCRSTTRRTSTSTNYWWRPAKYVS